MGKKDIKPNGNVDSGDSTDIHVEQPTDPRLYNEIRFDGDKVDFSYEGVDIDTDESDIYSSDWAKAQMDRKDRDKKYDYLRFGTYTTKFSNNHRMAEVPIDMIRHALTAAQTGHGKSILGQNSMIQMANKGHGFCYIDPKENSGDVMDLLRKLPEHRLDDVVYLNPDHKNHDKSITLNLFNTPPSIDRDTPEYNNFVQKQSEMVIDIMRTIGDSSNWGPRMDDLFRNLASLMITSEMNFNVADLYYTITNPQDAIPQIIEETKVDVGDEFISNPVDNMKDMSEDEYQTLLRRVNLLVRNPNVRDFIVNDRNDLNFKEIIEQDKILIIDINSDNDQLKNILMSYPITMLYLMAKNVDNSKFTVIADEFDIVLENDLAPIVDILKRGRSHDFKLWASTQTISSLRQANREVEKEMQTNVNLVLAGGMGDGEAKDMVKMFKTKNAELFGADVIKETPNYKFWIQSPKSESPVGVEAFAPYPHLRSPTGAKEIKDQSLDEYGTSTSTVRNISDSVRSFLSDSDRSIGTSEGMSAIDIARIFDTERNKTPFNGYASKNTIQLVLEHAYDIDIEEFNIENWLESQVSQSYIETKIDGDDIYYTITQDGRNLLDLTSGEGGSAGHDKHRVVTQKIRKQFAKYGIAIKIPNQDDGNMEKPDALGYVFANLSNRPFKNKVSIGDEFIIETENSTTSAKPSKMLKNLRKAFNQDKFVVFVTVERSSDSNEIQLYDKINTIILEREFGRKISDKGRRLYNFDNTVKKNGKYPLRKIADGKTDESRWYVDDGTLSLFRRDHKGNDIESCSWTPIEDFENWNVDEFAAYAESSTDGYIVYDNETGEEVGPIQDVSETDTYRQVKKPFVPDIEFDDRPTKDDFSNLVISENGAKLEVNYNGEFYDLGESPFSQDEESDDDDDESESEGYSEFI